MNAKRGLMAVLTLGFVVLGAGVLEAGGGPERTLVVVNDRSPLSRRIGEAWARLRHVPDQHVLGLPDVPSDTYAGQASIPLAQVVERILVPTLDYLDKADLVNEIDLIVYSTGFPYLIDVREFAERHGAIGVTTASLTAATFYAHAILRDDPVFLTMSGNQYFRGGLPGDGGSVRHLTLEERDLANGANTAYNEKDYKKSAELFERLLETYREDALSWYNLACDYARLGLRSRALDALEMSVAQGFSDPFWTMADPDLTTLRTESKFRELVQKMRDRKPLILDPIAFSSAAVWSFKEEPQRMSIWSARNQRSGGHYLAMMLGWTGLQGNRESEIRAALESSAAVDGSHPDGTVYYLRSKDKRARTRSAFFEQAARELQAAGQRVELLDESAEGEDGVFPIGRPDVIGTIGGAAEVDLEQAASRILPGALIDNLTGYGAAFWKPEQTKCTEFVRAGAAAVSGSVTEGGMVAAKYPTPRLHLYYAQGCTAAEAYYQATYAPFPMLFLGDPLARPYARFAGVRPQGLPGAPWSGEQTLQASVVPAAGTTTARVELYVDGWLEAQGAPGEALAVDTRPLDDGVHRGRLVAVEDSAIRTRSSSEDFVFRVANAGRAPVLQVASPELELGEELVLSVHEPQARRVEIHRGANVVAEAELVDGKAELRLPAAALGVGPARLFARTEYDNPPRARSAPVEIEVRSRGRREGVVDEAWALPGLMGTAKSPRGARQVFGLTSLHPSCAWPLWEACQDVGGEAGTVIELEGEIHADEDGLLELAFLSSFPLVLKIGDEVVLEAEGVTGRLECAELDLGKGWHPIHLSLTTPEGLYQLQAFLSGETRPDYLGGSRLRHRPPSTRRASPRPKLHMAGVNAEPILDDGVREGEAQFVSSCTVSAEWSRYQKDLQGFVVYPTRPEDDAEFRLPLQWVVEKKAGRSGWTRALGQELVLGWDPERGSRESGAVPQYVWVHYRPLSARELRLRPEDGIVSPSSVPLTEVELLEKGDGRVR